MKKRLGILFALSLLLVGVFVQAAAAATAYTLSEMSFIDSEESPITTETATEGIDKRLTLQMTFSGSGTADATASSMTVTASEGLTVKSATAGSMASGTSFTFSKTNDTTYSYSGTSFKNSAKTPTVVFVVNAAEEGNYTLTLTGQNVDEEPVTTSITLNVAAPVKPSFSDATVKEQTFAEVASDGDALENNWVLSMASDVTAENITFSDLASAQRAVAKSGLTLSDYAAEAIDEDTQSGTPAIEAGTLVIYGKPTKIGEYSFTLTPKDTATGLTGDATTFKFTVKGTAPTLDVYDAATIDLDDPAGENILDSTTGYYKLGDLYDDANKVIYVGKNLAKDKTQGAVASAPNNIKFHVEGSTNGLKMTGTITPDGSGLKFNTEPKGDSVNTDNGDNIGSITGTLSGTAAKKGNYKLTIVVENAETTRAGTKEAARRKIYSFTIEDVPAFNDIASTKKIVTWGEEFTLNVVAKNADYLAILDANTDPEVDGVNLNVVIDQKGDNAAYTRTSGADTAADFATKSTFTAQDASESGATSKTFQITGTWKPGKSGKAGEDDLYAAPADNSHPTEAKIDLIATKGTGTGAVYRVLPLTLSFKSVKPTITLADDIDDAFAYGETIAEGASTAVPIATMEGPGTLSWGDSNAITALNAKLPAGLAVDETATNASQEQGDNDYTSTLYVAGTPRVITPSAGVSVKLEGSNTIGSATTPFGTATANQTIKVTSDFTAPALGETSNALPSGYVAKGKTAFTDIDTTKTGTGGNPPSGGGYSPSGTAAYPTGLTRSPAAVTGEILLFAEPGPITWATTNLPGNVKLVPDTNDTRFASLQFDTTAGFNATTTVTKGTDSAGETTYSSPYTIRITNPNTSTTSTTLEGDIVVWDVPTVTALSPTSLTVNKAYSGKLTTTNTPTSYTIDPHADSTGDDAVQVNTANEEWQIAGGSKTLKFDAGTGAFSGTFDRIPTYLDGSDTKPGLKFTITPTNYAGSGTAYTATLEVKGVKPKFAKLGTITLTDGGSKVIETTDGTPDITLSAYIAQKDAEKLFSGITADMPLATATNGFTFTDDGEGKGTLSFSGTTFAYTNLPITVQATNNAGTTTQAYKVSVAGTAPTWSTGAEDSSGVISTSNGAAVNATYTATTTSPYEIKVSPSDQKNGIIPEVTNNSVSFTGTTDNTKATKTAFTMTVTNLSTKQKATKKITFDSLMKPTITSVASKLTKEVALGKKLSIKPTAKGSKGIKWEFDTTTTADISTAAALEEYGLELDEDKGTISGTTKKLTLNAAEDAYATKTVAVHAKNENISGSESAPVTITFGIYGAKPKVTTKSVTIDKGASTITPTKLATTPSLDDAAAGTVLMSFASDNLPDGVTIDPGTGVLTATSYQVVEATKGTSAKITVTNAEPGSNSNKATTNANVKFIVIDKKPVIETPDVDDMTASSTAKVTQDVTVTVDDSSCTGDTKLKWAIKTAPKRSQAKIKSSGNGKTATLTITVPKNLKNADDADITETIGLTVTNSKRTSNGTSDEKTITFKITPVSTATEATAEDATFDAVADKTADAKAEEKAATGEGEVKFGKTRTAPTAAQLGAVQKVLGDGYVIAAVLPEIEVTAEGQYDFEVDLDEKVAEGAELVWFAFPESGKETEDDEIVDFYTKAGEDTKVVPEDHVLVVSPWLNAEVKYEPVIAVKVDAAEAEAVDAESVKEAAEEQAAE